MSSGCISEVAAIGRCLLREVPLYTIGAQGKLFVSYIIAMLKSAEDSPIVQTQECHALLPANKQTINPQ